MYSVVRTWNLNDFNRSTTNTSMSFMNFDYVCCRLPSVGPPSPLQPNGAFLPGRSYLSISFVLVPDEAQLGVGCHGVVGSDVAVEQGTFHPDRFIGQNVVLLQVHRPVDASVHCRERTDGERNTENVGDGYKAYGPLYGGPTPRRGWEAKRERSSTKLLHDFINYSLCRTMCFSEREREREIWFIWQYWSHSREKTNIVFNLIKMCVFHV